MGYLLLIRHGVTKGNQKNIIQTDDTLLCVEGIEQAEKLAARLKLEFNVVRILSSDLLRAKQTADILAQSVGCGNVVPLPMLRERCTGNLRGRVYDEVLTETGLDSIYDPNNGTIEQDAAFESRVRSAWEELLEACAKLGPKETVAVVSHGMVLRLLLKNLEGFGGSCDVKNTSVTALDTSTLEVVKGVANCTKHLQG